MLFGMYFVLVSVATPLSASLSILLLCMCFVFSVNCATYSTSHVIFELGYK